MLVRPKAKYFDPERLCNRYKVQSTAEKVTILTSKMYFVIM